MSLLPVALKNDSIILLIIIHSIRAPLIIHLFIFPRNRDINIHIERVLVETHLRLLNYELKMGKVRNRKLRVRSKLFVFSKIAQDYCNTGRSDRICRSMQIAGRRCIISSCEYYNL